MSEEAVVDSRNVAIREIFDRLMDLPLAQRTCFFVQACGDDAALREEIEALLAADAKASNETFWKHSALRNEVVADSGATSKAGDTIGNYELVELIGEGGMGTVYRAKRVDAVFEKSVAIKLINGLFHSAEAVRHFRAERQILATLEHPNIAQLLDGGERADGVPYLIMEYVEGTSPFEYCRERNLSMAERLKLFRQICSAVHFAHQNMVIHRDLKPANILVTRDGTPKLLDFGIAKVLNPDPLGSREDLTRPGMLRLTARYASPEQVRGEPITIASDIYSLGVILYELLTEHSPYSHADLAPHQLMAAVCDEEPVRPSTYARQLRGDLDHIILRALRKPPLERYPSVDQFSEDILRFLDGRPVQACGEAPLYIAGKFIRRNRVVVTAAALLIFSLVGGLIEVSLARARAERRFNELRQLAHSVMFDYADAIERLPGSTPVRARLVKDALTYLDNLSAEADTPSLRREIVEAYVRVSNVQGNEYQSNLGDTASALASAQKAGAAAERMLRKDQTLPALDAAAGAFSTDGSLLYSSGDLPAADRAYQRAIDLRQKVARLSPQDVANKIALATCLSHMGDLYGGYGYQNLGKTAASLAFYSQSASIAAELTAAFPGNVDVAKESYETLISLSAAEGAEGRRKEAVRDLVGALAQIEKVGTVEPQDTNVKVELANAESRLGQMLVDDRQAADATIHLARSAGLLEALLRADPGNTAFRRGESVVEAQWATALRGTGQLAEGLKHNQNALRLAQSLSKDAPNSVQYRTDVGVSERKLSDGFLAAGDAAAALSHAQQAGQIFCPSTPAAVNPANRSNCGRSELAEGNAYLGLHKPNAAEPVFREAMTNALAQAQADPANVIAQSDLARAEAALAAALAQSGDAQSARTMYETAIATWSKLRQANSISAEDSWRSDQAAVAFSNLQDRR